MAVIGTPRVFQKKFSFIVEIEGFTSAAFTKMSAIEAEIAKVEQWQGGTLISDKSPGRVTTSDVTLERGVSSRNFDMWNWWLDVVRMSAGVGDGGSGLGLVDPFYKRQVELIQLDRSGAELRSWTLEGAWPTKMVVGDWDNEADENVIEMLTLTFDTFDPRGI